MTPSPHSQKTDTIKTDVVIIGAGPVGLFAVFQCGMLSMKCHVIDICPQIGGQCTALYPEKPIYDIPAHPQISGGHLIDALTEQASPFNPTYHLNQQVTRIEPQPDGSWIVQTDQSTRLQAKVIFIATGLGAFQPKKPPLKNLDAYEATGSVQYHVANPAAFADRRVTIAGGGDSAVDWAVALADKGAMVTVVHRRPRFRAMPAMVEKLKNHPNITLCTPYQLHSLIGRNDHQLEAVQVYNLDGETKTIPSDVLLPFFGLETTLGPIADWALDIDRKTIRVDPATCQTNQIGVYAMGDSLTYPGKLKLILCGFSEAAMAAHHAYARVFDGKALHFEYSTTKGAPGA